MLDEVTVIDLPRSDVDAGNLPVTAPTGFVAGPENRLAVVAIERLLSADQLPTELSWYNPLVLTGPTGSGKSQLARGITRHWSQKLGDTDVAYFSAVDFARQLHGARSDGQLELFRRYVAALQVLVIEDFHNLPRRTFLEREFRDTLDLLSETEGIVVITSREIVCLDRGLRDRLQSGLQIRLSLPGVQARLQILSQSAESRNLKISDKQLEDLSQQIDGPASRLLQALAEADLQQQFATPVAARHLPVKLKQVVAVVARYYSLTQAALLSSARRKSLVQARGMIVYLTRLLTDLSYAEIGRGLGGRDHSTIIHAYRSTLKLATSDSATQRDLEELKRILTSS